MPTVWKPTREQIAAAYGRQVPDLIAADLKVLFCGINPSLYSAAVGHHFARPGNRFWPTLHAAGFTSRLLSPFEEAELLAAGYGISNVVDRATASAEELDAEELVTGGRQLAKKVCRFRPRSVAFLGISAYRTAFDNKKAQPGLQPELLEGSRVWILPNPSGLNAHYQLPQLADLFSELRMAVEAGKQTNGQP